MFLLRWSFVGHKAEPIHLSMLAVVAEEGGATNGPQLTTTTEIPVNSTPADKQKKLKTVKRLLASKRQMKESTETDLLLSEESLRFKALQARAQLEARASVPNGDARSGSAPVGLKLPGLGSGGLGVGGQGQRELALYLKQVREQLRRQIHFPATVRERGSAGVVTLQLELLSDGSLKQVKLLQGSGQQQLDDEAIAAVGRSANYGVFPQGIEQERLVINIPIDFRLETTRSLPSDH